MSVDTAKTSEPKDKEYFVYILECADLTLYVGSTLDVNKRLYAHNNLKSGAHYTKIRRPVVLRHVESFKTYSQSRAREAEIKRLKKIDKIALFNPS
jgi:putative endonuclease